MAEQQTAYAVYSADDCKAFTAPDWAYFAGLQLIEQPADAAISLSLSQIGGAAGADRAWMFEYDADLLRFRNTHEWSRRGVTSFVEDLQDAPVTMISWLHQFLAVGRAVMIHRVEALPRPARSLQVEMLRQSDKSVLSVPVFHGGRLKACIGFDATLAPHSWSQGEVKALFQCAELIAAARYGREENRVSWRAAQGGVSALIYLRRQGGVRGVSPDTITGLRSSGDYTEVWLSDGSMTLDQRPLVQWMAMTQRSVFTRVHRTAIVNLRYIGSVDRRESGAWQVSLQNLDTSWPVSRSGRAELRTRLGI